MGRVIAVQGATGAHDVPGLHDLEGEAELRFAQGGAELREAIRDAEILLGWNFRAQALREAWSAARRLEWIHWGGAGVDALLFPELVESGVKVTNSRGVFDRPMAEYVLGLIIAFTKHFPETWSLQSAKRWNHRLTDTIYGKEVLGRWRREHRQDHRAALFGRRDASLGRWTPRADLRHRLWLRPRLRVAG